MNLDLHTLLIAESVVLTAMVAAVASMSPRRMHAEARPLERWMQGVALIVVALVVAATAGTTPSLFVVVIEHALMVTGLGLLIDALMRMAGQRAHPLAIWMPPVAVALAQVLQPNDPDSRTQLVMLVLAGQFLAAAGLAQLPASDVSRRSRLLMGSALVVAAAGGFGRAVSLALDALAFRDAEAVQGPTVAFMLCILVGLLGASMVFVLLQLERDTREGHRLATVDPLTGLFNRRTVLELGQRELARAQRRARPVSVLVADVDALRRINREQGSESGDRVLIHLTELMAASLQRQDLCGRVGSEEFCAILPDTALDGAMHVAERLRLRAETVSASECGTAYTLSIAVAQCAANEFSAEALLIRAEQGLRQRRPQTGNCVITLQALGEGRVAVGRPPPQPADAA